MLWEEEYLIYIANANYEIQQIKIDLGYKESDIRKALSEEMQIIPLIARGVIDSVAFGLSSITRKLCLEHSLLFDKGLLQLSVKGIRTFKEDLEQRQCEYPPNFAYFHDPELCSKYLKDISKLGVPYHRVKGGAGTKLVETWRSDLSKEKTISILRSSQRIIIPKNSDKLIKALHEAIPDRRGSEPFLYYFLERELDKEGLKLHPILHRHLRINLLKEYLPLVLESHAAQFLDYRTLGIPGIDSEISRYDIQLFLGCMGYLGLKDIILSLNDEQIIEVKEWREFRDFRDKYFGLIDEAKTIQEADRAFREEYRRERHTGELLGIIKNYSYPIYSQNILNPRTLISDLKRIFADNESIPFLRFKDRIIEEWKALHEEEKSIPRRLFSITPQITKEVIMKAVAISEKKKMEQTEKNPKKVFVVHGRNEKLRREMFSFLRSIGLEPIEWTEAVKLTGSASPYVGEILDAAFNHAQAVVVLLTPDDEARLRPEFQSEGDPEYEKNLTPQARPNVIFEAGMALGRYPDRTILVEVGELRPFSDFAGRHTIRLDNTTENRQDLAMRLRHACCEVNLDGTDWHKTGNFHKL